MINKREIEHHVKCLIGLISSPRKMWREIFSEAYNLNEFYRNFTLPLALFTACLTFLICTIQHSVWYGVRYALCDLTAVVVTIYLSHFAIREFLTGKTSNAQQISLSISAYCSVLFVFFNSLSLAVSNNFTAQLLSLVSLIFLRSLYVGIQEIEELQDGKKINLMIIGSSLIICIPIIIRKLCMIILHVPAFNI